MAKGQKLSKNTLGGRFGSVCIVGLSKVEYITPEEGQPLTAEAWEDVLTDGNRKKMCLCFFAPEDPDGGPMDPYIYLSHAEEHEVDEAVARTKQQLGSMPLLDLYRLKEEKSNTVRIMAAADVLFHWDSNGAYVQPTTQHNWVRDIQQMLKHYPRATAVTLYTNWPQDRIQELGNIENIKPLREMPLNTDVWVNMPSMQDQYGTLLLLLGIIAAAGAYGATYWQDTHISQLNRDIRRLESQMPNVSNLQGLSALLEEQSKTMKYQPLIPWIVKDVAQAIQTSGMQIDKFTIDRPRGTTDQSIRLATLTAKRDVYKGWLQEEPIAKGLLSHSVSMQAVRKSPGKKFNLEGYIDLDTFSETLSTYQKQAEAKKAAAEEAAQKALENAGSDS